MRIKFSSTLFFLWSQLIGPLCIECLLAPEVLAQQAFVEEV
ncbi:hypothetical protein [Pseudomonas sp. NPDC089569]